MSKIATIITALSALALSACSVPIKKEHDLKNQEMTSTEATSHEKQSFFLSFIDEQNNVLKNISGTLETPGRMRFSFETPQAQYNVIVAHYADSCKFYEHLSFYEKCDNPEQKVLFARGAITQYLKSNPQEQPKVDNFRIINVLKQVEGQQHFFKTQFPSNNVNVVWGKNNSTVNKK